MTPFDRGGLDRVVAHLERAQQRDRVLSPIDTAQLSETVPLFLAPPELPDVEA